MPRARKATKKAARKAATAKASPKQRSRAAAPGLKDAVMRAESRQSQPKPQKGAYAQPAAVNVPLVGRVSADQLAPAVMFIVILLVTFIMLASAIQTLYYYGYISAGAYPFVLELALLSFTLSILIYFTSVKKIGIRDIPKELGFTFNGKPVMILMLGVVTFLVIMVFTTVVSVLGQATNTTINTGVVAAFGGSPVWFLIFLAIIEPINEEILFRGFLVPRIGIVPAAIAFAIPHLSYNSTFAIEAIAALLFGLIIGYVFRRSKSIYPGIIAHIMVNSVAALALVYG